MRRILLTGLLILLIAPACMSPRTAVHDFPAVPGVIVAGSPRMPPQPPPRSTPCRQISRIPCDFIHCNGTGLDYVTLQCAGRGLTGRCEGNGGCRIGAK